MKRFITYIFLPVIFFIIPSSAQTTHVIETVGNTFSPADITIAVGDIVSWQNTGGGLHDVEADDGSFSSGEASTANWTYEYTFTTAGDFGYYCSVHGGAGGVGMSGTISVQPATSINYNNTPVEYALGQNYPNPFNPSTTISFSIAEAGFTELKVYNLTGQEVMTLISENLTGGSYSTKVNSGNLPSGVYIYQLRSGDFTATRKFTLLK